jgi:hypothetical protein
VATTYARAWFRIAVRGVPLEAITTTMQMQPDMVNSIPSETDDGRVSRSIWCVCSHADPTEGPTVHLDELLSKFCEKTAQLDVLRIQGGEFTVSLMTMPDQFNCVLGLSVRQLHLLSKLNATFAFRAMPDGALDEVARRDSESTTPRQ